MMTMVFLTLFGFSFCLCMDDLSSLQDTTRTSTTITATTTAMSGNSLSNNPPTSAGPGSENAPTAFDPRDQIQFRVGGFAGDIPASLSGFNDVESMTTSGGSVAAAVGDVDSESSGHANEEKDADGKTEQDIAREQREARFMDQLNSGKLSKPKLQQYRPGKVFTLPVEKPKLM